jgi:entericidin B
MMKKLSVLFIASVALVLLAGCSTVEGVGKDVQKAGSAIEKEAKK